MKVAILVAKKMENMRFITTFDDIWRYPIFRQTYVLGQTLDGYSTINPGMLEYVSYFSTLISFCDWEYIANPQKLFLLIL